MINGYHNNNNNNYNNNNNNNFFLNKSFIDKKTNYKIRPFCN